LRGGQTGKDSLKDTVELLSKAQIDILGVVLNDIDFRRERCYYAYHYKHYHTYYDEEGADGKKGREKEAGKKSGQLG